jgi:polysaccharide pyruvyl transferase WcaK-like protein
MKNNNNIGNNLVKFSIYIKLKELGFEPIIIGFSSRRDNIDFLKKHVKLKEIKKSYSELKEKDYDILMVNSDQTCNGHKRNTTSVINRGYLKFAENWTIPRFVYGASFGYNYWKFSKDFDVIARRLLKKFSGISVREKGAIKIVKKHLGIQPEFVLDPTFIINKK